MHENVPIYSQSIAFLSMSICFTPHDIAWLIYVDAQLFELYSVFLWQRMVSLITFPDLTCNFLQDATIIIFCCSEYCLCCLCRMNNLACTVHLQRCTCTTWQAWYCCRCYIIYHCGTVNCRRPIVPCCSIGYKACGIHCHIGGIPSCLNNTTVRICVSYRIVQAEDIGTPAVVLLAQLVNACPSSNEWCM